MAFIRFENVSFQYPNAQNKALYNVCLSIAEGDFAVLCGATGSGKSTLLRQIKKGICPAGTREGTVFYDGVEAEKLEDIREVCEIGMVFQDADSQLVMESVWHELAFSLENLGLSQEQMRARIAEMACFFGLEQLMDVPIHTLSGGQKRMVCLAAVLILRPRLLLLDEPVSSLDPIATREFLQMLHRIHEELGTTIIVSEHCLDELLPLANRVIVMSGGTCLYNGEVQSACRALYKTEETRMLLPSCARLFLKCGGTGEIPLTVRAARLWMKNQPCIVQRKKQDKKDKPLMLSCQNVCFAYDSGEKEILRSLSLQVSQGETLAILGGNGAGKSTLLKLMARIYPPQKGKIELKRVRYQKIARQEFNQKVGYLGQNPKLYFTQDTVAEEVEHLKKLLNKKDDDIDRLIKDFGISDLYAQHPGDLSGGQQQRLALFMVLCAEPELLLLDEPTSGLDAASKKLLSDRIKEWREQGVTIVLVTHDMDFAAACATRCALIFRGEITSIAEPERFFYENYFYTTTMARILRERCRDAICAEDVRL